MDDKGSLVFAIRDDKGQRVLASQSASKQQNWDHVLCFRVEYENDMPVNVFYEENEEDIGNTRLYYGDASVVVKEGIYDFYALEDRYFPGIYELRFGIFCFAGLSLLGTIICFLILMVNAGKRNEDEEIHTGPLYGVPFDILAGIYLGAFVVFMVIVDENYRMNVIAKVLLIAGVLFFICWGLGLCISLAVRVKKKDLIKDSFLYFIVKKTLQLLKALGNYLIIMFKAIPLVWKVLLPFVILSFLELINVLEGDGIFWFLSKTIMALFIIYLGLCMSRLLKAGEALAQGDLSYHTDTSKMVLELKRHGEDLNSIALGMARAVDEQLKSERLKTELITNVSHDLKTPLTSIINYSDLIVKEKSSSKKIREYSEVLNRQSQRLKRLLEDLVEVSKASSGNLEVALAPCDAVMFISQAAGEYEERLNQAGLTLVTSAPDHEVMIMADSRRMWRVFDNLMNNIVKYALTGTRVYLDLQEADKQAVIVFRNTSRDPLNIPPAELLERFTRGDVSRNSEGNGLGLSIAQSLCELQQGKMDIAIDGDLFKVTLSFPLI